MSFLTFAQRLTEDPWALSNVPSQLSNKDTLKEIVGSFPLLEPPVKLKLLTSMLYLRSKDMVQRLEPELQQLLTQALEDDDEWVRIQARLLTPVLQQKAMDLKALDDQTYSFVPALQELVSKSKSMPPAAYIPSGLAYLNKEATDAIAREMDQNVHFKIKPGASVTAESRAQVVADVVQRGHDAQSVKAKQQQHQQQQSSKGGASSSSSSSPATASSSSSSVFLARRPSSYVSTSLPRTTSSVSATAAASTSSSAGAGDGMIIMDVDESKQIKQRQAEEKKRQREQEEEDSERKKRAKELAKIAKKQERTTMASGTDKLKREAAPEMQLFDQNPNSMYSSVLGRQPTSAPVSLASIISVPLPPPAPIPGLAAVVTAGIGAQGLLPSYIPPVAFSYQNQNRATTPVPAANATPLTSMFVRGSDTHLPATVTVPIANAPLSQASPVQPPLSQPVATLSVPPVATGAEDDQEAKVFAQSNSISLEDRKHIVDFLRGVQVTPVGESNTRQIVLHTEQYTDSAGVTVIEKLLFEMNYETREWRKLRRKRTIPNPQALLPPS